MFKCAVGGLTSFQWAVCLGFASISFWVSLFAKFIPFELIGTNSEPEYRQTSIELREGLIKSENKQDALENAINLKS